MTKNKKGFTIIEVVLVLAIAGLIFLMVFIALPALQRSQRNTQREDDISRFLTAANDFQTNNNGKTPFTDGKVNDNFVNRYIDKDCHKADGKTDEYECEDDSTEFRDPDGSVYGMTNSGDAKSAKLTLNSTFDSNNHMVHAYTTATCGDEGDAEPGSGNRQYVLMYVLEGDSITCNDNH